VKKSIEDKINEGKSALSKEIDFNFASFQPQLLSHDKLSDKYTKFSKYIELTNIHNKPQHEPIPQHLVNTLYNINTIRNNYSYNPSQYQITKTYRTINSVFHNTNKHIRWRIAVYFSIKQLTNLNFQINQLSSLYNNKSLPFAHKHSQTCFQSVKSGDKETFQDLITYHKLIYLISTHPIKI
jgi:3-polyprenyl-4-hydroxybenzoate decarboxylase